MSLSVAPSSQDAAAPGSSCATEGLAEASDEASGLAEEEAAASAAGASVLDTVEAAGALFSVSSSSLSPS